MRQEDEDMTITANKVRPEVVAAITAAVAMMMRETPGQKVKAIRIRRASEEWSLAARGGRRL